MTGRGKRNILGTIIAMALLVANTANAQEWRASSSLIGESKYGQDFQRYDYVNPDAPKGGTLNATVTGTFDSFNPYIVQGSPAAGLGNFLGGLLYDTLMDRSADEGSVSHPLVADAYKYPDDYSSATYRLDPRARWHDGQPITVDDIVWSFNFLKANSPQYNRYFENVTEAKALSDREVQFTFDQKGNRELPKIIGDLVVLPKHWWEGTDANGKKRDITKPTLEIPLGSAAYKIKSFKPGAEIIWERVPDYWAAKLPAKIGRENFDVRRYTYFLDENAEWLAFTKGGLQDINSENSGRDWMTKYTFPALKAGDVTKKDFKADSLSRMQGFALNSRRPLFKDRRVRQALSLLYPFDLINRTMSFGLNTRITSYFIGSDLASSGLPQGEELEILNQYKDKLPPELFTQEWKLPAIDNPQDERKALKQAVDLLASAGWNIKGGKLVNAQTGAPFRFEILEFRQGAEATLMPYVTMLRKIGIDVSIRFVDQTQYVNRLNDFDFDMTVVVLSQSDSPGNEQRDFWSSKSADSPGSRNYEGIKDPVVDALVERVIFADNHDDLIAATHALDRVLLWNFYVVPQFSRPDVWLAYWNKFGIPDKQPTYLGPDIESWWIDPEKEKALAAKYQSGN